MVTVKLEMDSDIAGADKAKIRAAAILLGRACNTEEFKDFILNYSYERVWYTGSLWWKVKHTETVNNFHDTTLTNAQVYQKIIDGAEVLSPVKDGVINIYVDTYYKNNGVIGYTYPNSKWQWINLKFFRDYTAADVAGNMFHEVLHKYGFDHTFNFTTNRQYSVPYAIGYRINEICDKLLKQER